MEGGKYGGEKGFDHVFQNPDGSVTLLVDSKQFTNGATALSTKGAGKTMQLSDSWVRNVLGNLDRSSPASQAVSDALRRGTLVKGVVGVDKASGGVISVRVK